GRASRHGQPLQTLRAATVPVRTTRRPAADTNRQRSADTRAPSPSPRAAPARRAPSGATATADAVWRYANAALEACWLSVAALVPLYVDPLRAQSGLARGQLLQVLAIFMALLWLLQWAARPALQRPDEPSQQAAPLHD